MAFPSKKRLIPFSVTVDLPSVAAGAATTTTVSLTGSNANLVKKGDVVMFVGYDDSLRLIVGVDGESAANDQFVIRHSNPGAGAVDEAEQTLHFVVLKK